MGTHYVRQCRHGVVVSTCRCASRDKLVKVVPCPAHCQAANDYVPRHRADVPLPSPH